MCGYDNSIKYSDGKVTMCVDSGEGELWGLGETHSLSIKNWKLFYTVVCLDLDQPGFPEMLYVS